MTFLDTGFCSWDHLSAWIARGEPPVEQWPTAEPLSRRERVGDWLTDTGALILIMIWSAFGSFGLYTLAHLIF